MNDLLIKALITVMIIDASMQAVRQKKKEDKNKFYSETKLKCYRRKAMKQKTGRKR